ncbi:TPA: CpsD/CapB family tyrosine-protein kinase [Clostridium botulinum]|uniref:CpsD/CapB family tyrosine-protein kinase n=1 Tax=Clostridium TaxID=1485 RepID=UPI000774D15D|nr:MULTISPECIES: CpsD/CapB family tyrosine-protein kinase [Clostridium]AUM96483.1 capsular biosynthesis protein [Clostridium sporogenes]AVQ53935.1 capsular biosynthesis protein [Clostridium botulinum]MCW6110431.1 CpsD/CapB family tyrosine-protein kinase [Clostridium sporogenes]NFP91590.1 CpsD/CapB family tyrosine-protein kinase [Clostridium sporogenes]HBJ2614900.1 CpsD/CapB family tyrosine-protein kinase [Clostridium botulinum]
MNKKLDLITVKNPKSPISEAYRTLRTNIQFSSFDEKIKVIFVTSSTPGEGKSTTSANLAITMAQNGAKTILVDCDLRKPNVHKVFKLSNTNGLSNLLIEENTIDKVIQQSGIENLHILTSGSKPPNPSELLSSAKMKKFIDMSKGYYDYVILDTPPVGVVTDAQLVSQYSDGGVLVTASGQVEIESAIRAKELLQKVNAKILGVVLNKVDADSGNGYRYYNYYYEEDGQNKKRLKNK